MILSSPKLRARLTAEGAAKYLNLEVTIEPTLAGPFDPAALASNRDVLIVSHEPSMSHAIGHLTRAQVRLRRGGIAQTEPGELTSLWLPSAVAAIARMAVTFEGDTIDLEKDDQLPPTTREIAVHPSRPFQLVDKPILGRNRLARR